jgi:predicted Rossmann fold nucleotide-binding protein DprA/Smf involved in DNA uptake
VTLDLREYNQVVRWLVGRKLGLADLLAPERSLNLAKETGLGEERLTALLKRGIALGFAVEKWSQSGIWVVCRSDPGYPARYKEHLKDRAPPILFGAGERALLQGGGLAIVGSRNVDAEGESYAREVAAWCAGGGFAVISGGARGVDQVAMAGALEAGGSVVGVLADSLLRQSVARDARQALSEGRLLLLSPYHPEAGFNVGNAMGRNKLIYALADYGLVVSADAEKGGTWEGAQEELKRSNRKLLDLGAIAFPGFDTLSDPSALLRDASSREVPQDSADELPLFGPLGVSVRPVLAVKEPPVTPASVPASVAELDGARPPSLYEVVLPLLLIALAQPTSVPDLMERLDLTKPQLDAWLKRAVADKKVRRLVRPVRYVKTI